MKRPHEAAQQERLVAAWNETNPVGCKVEVTRDRGEVQQTTTRSEAQMLGGHTAVIWLDGIAGCYALERVKAIG
jgi:hypothetical protein